MRGRSVGKSYGEAEQGARNKADSYLNGPLVRTEGLEPSSL